MGTNLLIAIKNLIEKPTTFLSGDNKYSIRVNNLGESLETYVKDLFCGTLGERSKIKKHKAYSQYFSYMGNQNNPPDFMLKGGDAVEVKKIENTGSGLALNSSYPKDKLFSNSLMITEACRTCEDWQTKDLVYAVGTVSATNLKSLWLVYGDCYAASKNIYERIRNTVNQGINQITELEFSQTNELARVNKIDPLGITYLRIRGMWGIENPAKVFDYIAPVNPKAKLIVNALMLEKKYQSFPQEDRDNLERLVDEKFVLRGVEIKSPNNPAELLTARLLSYTLL